MIFRLGQIGMFLIAASVAAVMAFSKEGNAAPSVPRVACQISTPTWCIAFGFPNISVIGQGSGRVWSIGDNATLKDGPLVIVEPHPNCSVGEKLNVEKLSENRGQGRVTISFSLTSDKACILEFQIPSSDGDIPSSYQRAMDFGVLVGGQQLYKASKK